MSTTVGFLDNEDQFAYWRHMSMAQAHALCEQEDWWRRVDAFGANALMQACAFFAPVAVLDVLLSRAIGEDVLARMCQCEDQAGVRLPAYALHYLHREWLGREEPASALFAHGVRNGHGHGLLRQLMELSRAEDGEEATFTLTFRGVGVRGEQLRHLGVEDWQAGLEGREEALLQWWFGTVMRNETSMGLAFHDDLDAVLAWLLPAFQASPREQWTPVLRDCLGMLSAFRRLHETRDTDPASVCMQILEEERAAILPYRDRFGNRFVMEVLLYYQHREELWQAFTQGAALEEAVQCVAGAGAPPARL